MIFPPSARTPVTRMDRNVSVVQVSRAFIPPCNPSRGKVGNSRSRHRLSDRNPSCAVHHPAAVVAATAFLMVLQNPCHTAKQRTCYPLCRFFHLRRTIDEQLHHHDASRSCRALNSCCIANGSRPGPPAQWPQSLRIGRYTAPGIRDASASASSARKY